SRVVDGVSTQVEVLAASDADSMWNILASNIKDAPKDTLGVAIGTSKTHTAWRDHGGFVKRESEGREDVMDTKRLPHFDCYYSNISQTKMRTALQKMGRNKAIGLDQIPIEAWKSLGDEGIFWLTRLFNKIFTSAKMPEEWRLSEVIPIFKNKGYVQVCSNYRVEAIHLTRSLMMKYKERQRDMYMAFLDLEKAYDSVSRELIWKTLVDKGTPRRYIRVISNEEVDICIGDNILQPKVSFRYLGSMLHKSRRIDEDVSNRIKAA
nr:hypothetical protein [Tanacetum cinerariifolium]